jgi:hypothetical protein
MAHGVGAELILEELARSPMDDDSWIQSIEAFTRVHAATAVPEIEPVNAALTGAAVGALILLCPEAAAPR